jgi:hypothetical protein
VSQPQRIAFDLPGDGRLEGLNREVAQLIARDVDVALAALPERRHAEVARDLVRRLVTVEAQLLTGAVVEALGRRLRTRAALAGLRALTPRGAAGEGARPGAV